MTTRQALSSHVGTLLKQYRRAAGLTQEALAERAGLSVRGIQDLERGVSRAPRADTVALLAAALDLSQEERARLADVARGRRTAPVVPSVPGGESAALPAPASTLPVPLTALIGRERELAVVRELLLRPVTRLLSLTGAAGVGKTRLALALAAAAAPVSPDGVWCVELAALADPQLVASAIVATLGLREAPGTPTLATLITHLRTRTALVLLDNCEHLIASCATVVTTLLHACPSLRILVTSREPLAVAGETLYRVPSLAAPDLAHLPPPEQLATYGAIQLFVHRAQSRCLDFALTPQNAHAVAEICADLDGIPLAIELAAARVGALPVAEIAWRLEDRFRLLTKGARTALPRQQTLRAALDWSWDLLAPVERGVLARLAAFAGGCTLAAAQIVCADGTLDAADVLDALDALADKSLLNVEEPADGSVETRYCLLESVRQYGLERLAERGEATAVRDRHLQWYATLTAEADRAAEGAAQSDAWARLEREHENLRAALSWSITETASARGPRARGETGARLASALWRFWRTRSYLSEGLYWLEMVRARADLPPALQATVVLGLGYLSYHQGSFPSALAHATESRALYRALEQPAGIAEAQVLLGMMAELQDEYDAARTLVAESLALFRELGDARGVSTALYILGQVARDQGQYAEAGRLFTESCALARRLGDQWGLLLALTRHSMALMEQGTLAEAAALAEESVALSRAVLQDTWSTAWALCNLAQIAAWQGQAVRARALAEESLALNRTIGAQWGAALARGTLALLAREQGDVAEAVRLYRECLGYHRSVANRWRVAECLEALAGLAVVTGDAPDALARAARLFGAAEALRAQIGAPRPPIAQPAVDRAVTALRVALGAKASGQVWAAGARLSWQEAVDLALA